MSKEGLIPLSWRLRTLVSERFPGLHETLREAKEFSFGLKPYVVEKNVAGIHYKMYVGSDSERAIIEGPAFEGELIKKMLGCTKLGDVIYDIGSAPGTHTIPLAIKTDKEGAVYSFEPDKQCAKSLRKNVELNGLSNVTILQTALWGEDGIVTLHTNGRRGKPAQVTKAGGSATEKFKRRFWIQARRMDSLVKDGTIEPPQIIKIDVEGAGRQVLEGMGNLRPRHVFIEIHPMFDENPEEIAKLLEVRNYELSSQRKRGNELHLHFVLL